MKKFYVACGSIREIVDAESVRDASIKALLQHSERTADSGELFTVGEYISVSEKGFDDDDALWNCFDNVRKEAGIVLPEDAVDFETAEGVEI